MFIHAFGAYFGLAVARVLYSEDIERASGKEGAVYHSDLFSMIGESSWYMLSTLQKRIGHCHNQRNFRKILKYFRTIFTVVFFSFKSLVLCFRDEVYQMSFCLLINIKYYFCFYISSFYKEAALHVNNFSLSLFINCQSLICMTLILTTSEATELHNNTVYVLGLQLGCSITVFHMFCVYRYSIPLVVLA